MPSFPLKVFRFRRGDPLDVNSLTLVREHNAGSARLSAAYRTDQSDRTDVFWHYHTFDHDTSHCRPMCNSALLEKMDPEPSAGCRHTRNVSRSPQWLKLCSEQCRYRSGAIGNLAPAENKGWRTPDPSRRSRSL